MPRFYFDATLQGEPETDPEGIELASRAVARQEGVRAAAEMVKRHHGENAKDVTLAIREGEEPVATIRLSLTIEEPS
jgi:DNA-binding IclR family transcriptional regulator